MQTLMLSVNKALWPFSHLPFFAPFFEIGNLDLFNVAYEQYHTNEYNSFWNGDKTDWKTVNSEQGLMVQSHLCFY